MLLVNIATPMMYIVFFNGVEKSVRSVACIMLAGPHERTMDDALNNLDEMLKLDAELLQLPCSYPGTDSFEDGAKGIVPR